MKNRLEYKYLVPLIYLDKLRANLSIYLEPDEYAAVRPSREYTVHSIYLDGFDYRCYYEKIDGVHTRKKFRIRGYNKEEDRSPVFFEIKRKHDNFISKDRAGVAHRDVGVALVDHRIDVCINGEERCSLSNFYHYHELRHLEPKILVVYEREPFECKFGSKLRITIDKHLRSKIVSGYEDLFDDSGLAECFRKVFILEVKFFQVLPQWRSQSIHARSMPSTLHPSLSTSSRNFILKQDIAMLQNLQGIDLFSPTLLQIILSFVVSLFCSFIISVVYRYTYRGPGYSNSFIISLVALSLITALVIMVIGNNLARAFGLVGALSIIRFRTAVKDTFDIVYLFFGLAVGMAAGVGYFRLAVVGTIAISLVLLVASKAKINIFRTEQFLLQLQYADEDITSVKEIMDSYCLTFDLINIKTSAGAAPKEFSYYISLKRKKDYLDFVKELKKIRAVQSVNLFRDEEHI
jgi:uncharacterized membrane protein YhiD involved in acid resistance